MSTATNGSNGRLARGARATVDAAYRLVRPSVDHLRTAESLRRWRPRITRTPTSEPRVNELVRALRRSQSAAGASAVTAFEHAFAARVGAEHGVAVTSCTAALYAGLAALDLPPGSEVVLPALGHASHLRVCAWLGLVPRPVDVDPATGIVGVDGVRRALTERTSAVLVVHFGGRPAPVDALAELCAEQGPALIEDAAHGQGGELHGRALGTFGRAGCFSFSPGKGMSLGEGGMLVTSDGELARSVRGIVDSRQSDPNPRPNCFKLQLSPLLAAVGEGLLRDSFESQVARRRAACRRLVEELADQPFLDLPTFDPQSSVAPVWLLVSVAEGATLTRQDLVERLGSDGIPARLLPSDCFVGDLSGAPRERFPGVEAIRRNAFVLGAHLGWERGVVEDVLFAVRRAIRASQLAHVTTEKVV